VQYGYDKYGKYDDKVSNARPPPQHAYILSGSLLANQKHEIEAQKAIALSLFV
jgi:hypothetical protein